MSPLPHSDRQRPQSLKDLFISFTVLALQGFGGVLTVVQAVLVEKKRWMTREEFLEDWAVAQVMPGPNVINLSLIVGGRYFGLPGAMAALAGLLTLPLTLVLALAMLHGQFAQHPGVAGALRGMGAVAVGLIAATALRLLPALRNNALGWRWTTAFGLASLLAIAVMRLPLVYVIFGLGGIACAIAYRRMAP